MKEIDYLRQGLETAFVDGNTVSNTVFRPQFVSNNHKEGKKVLSSVEDELLTCDRFRISVAFITRRGIEPFLLTLQELEKRNIPGEILTTNYLTFSEPDALQVLNGLSNITLKMYDVDSAKVGFHTKGYIFQEKEIYKIIIGSSNITDNALTTNKEWNAKIVSTKDGEVAKDIISEFEELWDSKFSLNFDEFFDRYNEKYKVIKHQRDVSKKDEVTSLKKYTLEPNSMQVGFISNLRKLINAGKKKALLISATGTGKTYASAFAMRELGFKKILFVAHRNMLINQALSSYKNVFDDSVSMGIVGDGNSDYDADFIFAMVETIHKEEKLIRFSPDHFDCVILDEAHHSPANTYQKVMEYFKPKLFLGMTATPDKRDDHIEGRNVYELFDYQIAYEIRLQKAMEEDLLCPFHYFGITDLSILDDNSSKTNFSMLTSDERVRQVIKQAKFFGYSGERVKGLIFCSTKDECTELSRKFNRLGYRTRALFGTDDWNTRKNAFERLAMNEEDTTEEMEPLDYIFSVDILNEGVDIVEVNQVIMLRPTESPIVFVQQLGRGLRKADGKDFVVILDFIGNYKNNFMIPVALSGDRSYNSDVIRKYVISGNRIIPGASTVHFDEIAKERIFNSIDKISSGTLKGLIRDGYINLKNKLGRRPLLFDFYENDEIDPLIIIREYKTYFAFVRKIERNDSLFDLSEKEELILEYLSKTVLSGVRPVELEILNLLLSNGEASYSDVIENCKRKYDYAVSTKQLESAYNLLKGSFVSKNEEYEKYSTIEILIQEEGTRFRRLSSYADRLQHMDFYNQIKDIIQVGLSRYSDKYTNTYNNSPFVLYEKYSRRDVCLLMNSWKDISSTMYGMAAIGDDVFIFVTYHKAENTDENKQYVDGKPDYADEFIDDVTFRWDSQIGHDLNGDYMDKVLNTKRKHLLVQKTDAENDFFYMGEFDVEDVCQDKKKNNKGKLRPICKLKCKMHTVVREDLLNYLQSNVLNEALAK